MANSLDPCGTRYLDWSREILAGGEGVTPVAYDAELLGWHRSQLVEFHFAQGEEVLQRYVQPHLQHRNLLAVDERQLHHRKLSIGAVLQVCASVHLIPQSN